MLNIILFIALIYAVVIWAIALLNYDWSKFEQDSEGDDFLKPLD